MNRNGLILCPGRFVLGHNFKSLTFETYLKSKTRHYVHTYINDSNFFVFVYFVMLLSANSVTTISDIFKVSLINLVFKKKTILYTSNIMLLY